MLMDYVSGVGPHQPQLLNARVDPGILENMLSSSYDLAEANSPARGGAAPA